MRKKRDTKHLITESINQNTVDIDKLSVKEAIDLICNEDRAVFDAIEKKRDVITQAATLVIDTLKNGGRIFFAGAGTSGRLGVLEAAECPPTFGTSPELFQAVIAGGRDAVWESVEGAEDSEQDAKTELRQRGLGRDDTLIGIAASTSTPFVSGALDFARQQDCKTILVTCNPVEVKVADIDIELLVGPEVIVGSTRMKSGTATKMVLNMITTTAMVQMGKTYGNLMVDLMPRSKKLRSRAVRIVNHLCGTDDQEAENVLERAGWNVKAAILMKKLDIDLEQSEILLKECNGFLYLALGNHK